MERVCFSRHDLTPETHESDTMIEVDVTFHCIALALVIRFGKNRVAPRDTLARLFVERTRISIKLPHSAREAILSVGFLQRYLIVD